MYKSVQIRYVLACMLWELYHLFSFLVEGDWSVFSPVTD